MINDNSTIKSIAILIILLAIITPAVSALGTSPAFYGHGSSGGEEINCAEQTGGMAAWYGCPINDTNQITQNESQVNMTKTHNYQNDDSGFLAVALPLLLFVLVVIPMFLIYFIFDYKSGITVRNSTCNQTPILCKLGLHEWGAGERVETNFFMRIPGTGFDYIHTCERCGKTVKIHEGGV